MRTIYLLCDTDGPSIYPMKALFDREKALKLKLANAIERRNRTLKYWGHPPDSPFKDRSLKHCFQPEMDYHIDKFTNSLEDWSPWIIEEVELEED